MNEESGDRISKLLPYKSSKVQSRSFIKDGDLQIQVPQTKKAARMENAEAFSKLYTHYANQVSQTEASKGAEQTPNVVQEMQHEMEEAKVTYNMMMDISNSIAEAYKDLKNLQ